MIDTTVMARRVRNIIDQVHELRRPRIVPSEDALQLVLGEVFWSSIDQYEGQSLRARIYFAPESALTGDRIVQLKSPLSFSRDSIHQLSPAHGSDGALLVLEDATGLHISGILGSSPFSRGGSPLWLCVESRGPGAIRVRIGDNPILDFTRGNLRALGGTSFDRHVTMNVLARVLSAGHPHSDSLKVSSLLLNIGRAIENSGTGGALWILPTDPSMAADVSGLGYQIDLSEDWWEPFREMWEYRTAFMLAAENAPGLQQAAQEWDHLRHDAIIRSIASLARIDGAILITGAPHIVAFGVICNKFSRPASEVLRLTDPSNLSIGNVVDASEFGGSRHRSAIDFCCSHSPACAVVASHDGGITVFASWEAGRVVGTRVSEIEWEPRVRGE